MKADAKTEAEVITVVNRLFESFSNRDLDSIAILFVPDPDMVFSAQGETRKVLD